MSSSSSRRGLRAVVSTVGLGLVATPLTLLPGTAQAAPVPLTLLNINDFHGRINDDTLAFAATVESLRAEAGEGSTLFLSAGDNIGASVFASAVAEDVPTIEVLNQLGLDASAVGNHEFDRGISDLTDRVEGLAEFPYLGANVYDADGRPVLDEYAIVEASGLQVGIIGVVTEETPSLVSPGGIEGLTFGDPVDAVNRVAAQLSDGNPDNGEADVLVAEFHEGGPRSEPVTLAEQTAASQVFARIVQQTSAEVDVIFNGHTHQRYAYLEAPVPGTARTRPVVQSGQYGSHVGRVELTVEDTTGEVTAAEGGLVPQLAPVDANDDGNISDEEQAAFDAQLAEMVAASERLQQVEATVEAALAEADVIGRQPVGEITTDITTAFQGGEYVDGRYTGGERDDRGSESTLGNTVANALRDVLSAEQYGAAEIGVVNPGGLRAELLYAGNPEVDTDGDGVVTYAEANAVLPFVNNLWTLTLTGAQLKQVLEQQWQPEGSSREYLHLGLSDNVSVVQDPTRPRGERIVAVTVDGRPLRMGQEYRIGTFSFLAQGGDNFTAFAEATDVQDTGLVDREAWIGWIEENSPISPSYARRQVVIRNAPDAIRPTRRVRLDLERLNLTSLGSPVNRRVVARAVPRNGEGRSYLLDRSPVGADGTARLEFRVPRTLRNGYDVRIVARPTGTEAVLPIARRVRPNVRVNVRPERVVAGVTQPRLVVRVGRAGQRAAGVVVVRTAGDRYATRLRDGRAVVRIRDYARPGLKAAVVRFRGNARMLPVRVSTQVRVVAPATSK